MGHESVGGTGFLPTSDERKLEEFSKAIRKENRKHRGFLEIELVRVEVTPV